MGRVIRYIVQTQPESDRRDVGFLVEDLAKEAEDIGRTELRRYDIRIAVDVLRVDAEPVQEPLLPDGEMSAIGPQSDDRRAPFPLEPLQIDKQRGTMRRCRL